MVDRYTHRILRHLADSRYEPRSLEALARELSVPEDEVPLFRQAVEHLLGEKQLILGTSQTVALPPPGRELEGIFRRHERGFGFIVPDALVQHGDLFVPQGQTGEAMTGDRVRAKVIHQRGRAGEGRSPYVGRVLEILQRSDRPYVGQLVRQGTEWVVEVDGRVLPQPVRIRDPEAKNARPGDKVVIELVRYPEDDGTPAEGVITEVLGAAGEPDVETLSVIRAYGLAEAFPEEVLQQARESARQLEENVVPEDRLDLTDSEKNFILTIDPPDAKDFDDAIQLRRIEPGEGKPGEAWELGVHIADVAHFIPAGSAIDQEAYQRGNSTYLPRKVIPMLPELLSNGVCSLQPGVNRFAKSCFIRYDAGGKPLSARFARSVIRSAKRLTYREAQALIEGDLREARRHAKTEANYPRPVLQTLQLMDELAKVIRQRRLKEGMIVLGLPEVELIFDDSGRVVDAEPEDTAFTHTIIEMFMVEANEAAARLFAELSLPMIRRVHPDPDAHAVGNLQQFARVAGFNIPKQPSRHQLQELLEKVRGKPAQHAVHMAVLRTLSKAEYAPWPVGHFALASADYTHFTSPIRRYPDLVVHRAIDAYLQAEAGLSGRGRGNRGRLTAALQKDDRLPEEEKLQEIGRHCSSTERNSESAERALRNYLVLELLSHHLGEDFDGTVTGVTGQGVFVQIDRYLVDGFIKVADLPVEGAGRHGRDGDRWQLNRNTGALVAQRSGRVIAIGEKFRVRVAQVDLARRQMELIIVPTGGGGQKKGRGKQAAAEGGESDAGRKPRPARDGSGPGKPARGKPKPKPEKTAKAKKLKARKLRSAKKKKP